MKDDPLAALADIEILAPPDAGMPLAPLLIALVVAIGVTAWLIARRRRKRKPVEVHPTSVAEALRRLAALRADWETGTVDNREAGYRLCALLRIGLGLPVLDPVAPPPALPRGEEWTLLLHGLQRLRYERGDASLSEEAFELARLWLSASETQAVARNAVRV